MPPPTSRSSSALLLALALAPAGAWAQACCAGSSALTPARLGIHEDAAVGAIVRGTGVLGSYAASGLYLPSPAGTGEFDGELDLVGTLRLLGDLQLTVLVPGLLTWRGATGLSEVGGGLGDLNLSGRWDFTHAGQSRVVPGIAVLAGVVFPTGRAPEEARNLLATDATGTGAFQLTGGVALEQSFGPWLVNLTGIVAWRTPRTVQGVSESLGVQLQALAGVGHVFSNEAGLALSLGYLAELDATLDGHTAPGTGRGLPSVGVSGTWPLADTWRLQGGLTYNLPLSGLGRNQTAGLAGSLSLLAVWL